MIPKRKKTRKRRSLRRRSPQRSLSSKTKILIK